MTDFVDSWPTARLPHRCGVCSRTIRPGEAYWRQAGLDRGQAWTNRTCQHCESVVHECARAVPSADEWEPEHVREWLADEHPAVAAWQRDGWSWLDGVLVPVPFADRGGAS